MRLHRLTMTAIGPFVTRTELDLARFGESGLFLIEGRTGSGKSTVLDAISFALYGKPAQSSAALERLKSHHAPAGTEPVVELVFETQRGRYRIRRTPSYDRPKKRGTGTTRVNMTVHLYRLTGADSLDGGELISHSLGDVEDEVSRAVRLSHAQFVQTVLLPQGEFASFLTAKTEVKRALLQRLFGTELLEATQRRLVEGRARAERLRRAAVESVRDAVHAFAGAAALGEDEATELLALTESGTPAALSTALTDRLDGLAEVADRTEAAAADAERTRATADAAMRSALELEQRRGQRAQLRDQEGRLLAAADEQAAATSELTLAERALTVSSAADGLRSATRLLDEGRAAETEARRSLPAELADAGDAELHQAASARSTVLGELAAERARERTLAGRRAELEAGQAELTAQVSLIDKGEDALAQLPVQRRALVTEQLSSERAAARLPALTAERDRATARLQAARQAEIAAAEATRERLVAQELFDSVERAEQRFAQLQQQWRASIASELGLALKAGDACSVCGSIEHPRPARPSPDHVSQDQLRQAERDLAGLRRQVEKRRGQLADKQAELVQLQLAADQLTPETARATLDTLTAERDQVEADAGRLPGLIEELRLLDEQTDALRAQLDDARQAAARRTERLASLAAELARDEDAVRSARAGHASVAARMAAIESERAAAESVAGLSEQGRALLAAATAAGGIFRQALAEAAFADEQGWRRALRTSSELARLRAQVRGYDEHLAEVRSRLADVALCDPALDDEPAELDALRSTLAEAQRSAQQAAREHGAAADRLASAGELVVRVRTAIERSATVLADTAAAIRVGNLVAGLGDNQLKIELTTYVLVRRFAEVLAAANGQLHRISQGRYELEHTDARTGNARSGLNLRVLDLHTGRSRDPATLSGGETFYVSLALALGLADVVRAESGGIDLGTLFIDEGFGSLDAEVLDEVISVLDSLRHGGRAVGIVSHVSELKMRIADRIQVVRDVDGTSRLTTTV
ncbi:MAG TPA: SMC family ATPase [Jatrophihabitans sp.]|nr:SMC family ATPase [Jatrophihabitans sp.]